MKKMKLMYLVMSLLCLSLVLGLQELSIESPATLRGTVNITGIVNYSDDPVSVTAGTFALGENTYTIESTMPNQTEFLLELDSTSIPDGDYNLTFNVSQDSSTSLIAIEEVIVDNIDTVPPNLTSLTIDVHTFLVGGTVFSNMNELKTVTVEATDEFTGINSISVLFENETYQLVTLLVNGTSEVNFSTFSEGNYTIFVNVTDNSNNTVTQEYSLVIDRIKPAINVRCNPEDVIEGNRVSCTCSASDLYLVDGWSFQGGAREESTTASNPQNEPYLSSICSAVDLAGNRGSKQGEWKVLAGTSTSGSGSSSGGGSSGGSSSASGNSEKKTWNTILAGVNTRFTLTNKELPITEIGFKLSKDTSKVTLEVKKLNTIPNGFKLKVYKHIDILNNKMKEVNGLIQIRFKVEKKWLNSQNLGVKEVALYHLENEKWVEMPTFVRTEDKDYVYYSSASKSLSPFVIGEKEVVEEVVPQEEVVLPPEETEITDSHPEAGVIEVIGIQESVQKEESLKPLLFGLLFAIIIISGIFLWWYYQKTKSNKEQYDEVTKL